MGVEADGGYLPLGWAGRTGTGEDSALKSVLPTPEPQIGLLVLFPGGCLEVLWYWGGSLGTQGWYPNCSWPLAALLLETACRRAVRKGKKQPWTRLPSLLTREYEVDVEGAEGLTVPVNHVYVCKTQKCRELSGICRKIPFIPI